VRRDHEGRSSEAKRRLLSDLFDHRRREEQSITLFPSRERVLALDELSCALRDAARGRSPTRSWGERGANEQKRELFEGGRRCCSRGLEQEARERGSSRERGARARARHQSARERGQSRPLSPRFQASLSPLRLSGPITEIVTKEPHGGGEKESAPGEERGSEKGKRLAAATAAAPSIAAALDDAKNQETANSLEPVSEHDHQRQALALLMGAGRGLGGLF